MSKQNLLLIETLCTHYEVELSFFQSLNSIGLIEIIIIDELYFIHQNKLSEVEKMIRLHNDLDLNLEGIDVVLNLLHKVDTLQAELNWTRNKLKRYEDDL